MNAPARYLSLLVLVLLASAAPAAGAGFEVHAHRGGPLSDGAAVAPEDSLTAFKSARGRGADVIELDTHVTSDDVPFALHDGSLDRTTDCTGNIAEHTAAEVDACHIDVLGAGDAFTQAPGSTEPVPRLTAVLEWAKSTGARLNVELNYYPTEPAASKTPNFIADVLDAIDASGVPKSRVLIQSFLPGNLDPAKARGYETSLITFKIAESSAVSSAQKGGYEVLEPEWPLDDAKAFVKSAHAAGKRVIPFTLDARSDILAARRAGTDGVITDDPKLARAVNCAAARRVLRGATRALFRARKAAARAHTPKQRRAAARRVKAAKRKWRAAGRTFQRACD
jgi:glycerophosphoryl diester phosphodiesterase